MFQTPLTLNSATEAHHNDDACSAWGAAGLVQFISASQWRREKRLWVTPQQLQGFIQYCLFLKKTPPGPLFICSLKFNGIKILSENKGNTEWVNHFLLPFNILLCRKLDQTAHYCIFTGNFTWGRLNEKYKGCDHVTFSLNCIHVSLTCILVSPTVDAWRDVRKPNKVPAVYIRSWWLYSI